MQGYFAGGGEVVARLLYYSGFMLADRDDGIVFCVYMAVSASSVGSGAVGIRLSGRGKGGREVGQEREL